jgi:hypothetical protein
MRDENTEDLRRVLRQMNMTWRLRTYDRNGYSQHVTVIEGIRFGYEIKWESWTN